MSWSYFIDVSQSTVFTRLFGVITPNDVQEQQDAVKADPLFRPYFKHFIDASEGQPGDFSADKVRAFATSSIFDNTVRRAIVVKGDLAFGLARMFATYREIHGETNLHVFRTAEEAFAWMGIQEPRF